MQAIFRIWNMKIVLFVCQKLLEEIKKKFRFRSRQTGSQQTRGEKQTSLWRYCDCTAEKRKRHTWFIVEILNCDPFALLCDAQPDTSNRGPGTWSSYLSGQGLLDQVKVQMGNRDLSLRTVKATQAQGTHKYKVRPDQTTANFFGH
jgi:hypothetical protein